MIYIFRVPVSSLFANFLYTLLFLYCVTYLQALTIAELRKAIRENRAKFPRSLTKFFVQTMFNGDNLDFDKDHLTFRECYAYYLDKSASSGWTLKIPKEFHDKF